MHVCFTCMHALCMATCELVCVCVSSMYSYVASYLATILLSSFPFVICVLFLFSFIFNAQLLYTSINLLY